MSKLQNFVDFKPGQAVTSARVTLGYFDENNPNSQYYLRKVRAHFLHPYVDHYEARIVLPGGIEIGPIDVPFDYNTELPATIEFSCLATPENLQTIMVTHADLPDAPNVYGATFLNTGRSGATFPIPDAVVAVTVYDGATATFLDGASNPICSTTGGLSFIVARPRLAKFITATSETTIAILYHY